MNESARQKVMRGPKDVIMQYAKQRAAKSYRRFCHDVGIVSSHTNLYVLYSLHNMWIHYEARANIQFGLRGLDWRTDAIPKITPRFNGYWRIQERQVFLNACLHQTKSVDNCV